MDDCQNCRSGTSFPGLHHESHTLYTLPLFSHTHTCTYTRSYMLTYSETPKQTLSHTHEPSPALPLRWNCRNMPFPHGALPATHSTLPVCDPWMCWKRKHLTYCPFLLMLSHRITSYVEYRPSTVNAPLCLWGKRWRNAAVCLWKLLVARFESVRVRRRLTHVPNSIFNTFLSSVSFYSHL